ncbi:hypothetical protein [Cellulomonas sp. NPDC058312]|uniref:hypothetical protein n=1 Tax=Cellulomonas sp. NPDC058312 TaxID=3346441 RepID=UPI0036EEC0C3
MTPPTPCAHCTALAQRHEHEPLIVDDAATWTRLWRCSRCSTLWLEGDRLATPISEADADARGRWRDYDRWIAGTTVRRLLQDYRAGLLGDVLFGLAMLHHDVLSVSGDAEDAGDLVLYSGVDAAQADGRDPTTLTWVPVARRLGVGGGGSRVRIDPASPWWCDLGPDIRGYLASVGRRTVLPTDPAARPDGDVTVAETLASARAECLASGCIEGLDFHVEGFATRVSSEYLDLRHAGGFYEIVYSDMGRSRVLARSASAHDARTAFVAKVAVLAQGRGRGPATSMPPETSWADGLDDEQYLVEYKRRYGLTQTGTGVTETLASARAECLASGCVEGLDFHVVGFPVDLSSEHYDLGRPDGAYEVRYSDIGKKRVLLRSESADDARALFVEKVGQLAAIRGHGSVALRPPEKSWTEGLTDDEVLAEYDRRYGLA